MKIRELILKEGCDFILFNAGIRTKLFNSNKLMFLLVKMYPDLL